MPLLRIPNIGPNKPRLDFAITKTIRQLDVLTDPRSSTDTAVSG